MKPEFVNRLHFIFIVLVLMALLLVGRLFFLQVINGDNYKETKKNQHITAVFDDFDRGNIFMQTKDGELISAATLSTGYTVAIDPRNIKNPEDTYKKLSSYVDIDSDDFFKKAFKTTDPYEEIVNRVPENIAYKIQGAEIPGVSIHQEKWRFYPGQESAAHVLGFVGYRGDNLAGVYGLERYYNDVLSRGEKKLYVNFFAEIFSNITETIFESDNTRQGDLVLTIEPQVQLALSAKLHEIEEKWSSDTIGGVIIDPRDGSIYAMDSLPTFDPNNFQTEESVSVFKNPIVENVYEMGSIIKPLTMATALDSGAVTPETTYNDKGYIVVSDARIENFDGKARGLVSMQEVLNQSLNTGAVFAMQQTGRDEFRSYFLNLGLGEETGIDMPHEARGLVDNLSGNVDVEYATAAFGQGIALTPIATAKALSALGNGGKVITPFVVDRIDYVVRPSKETYPDPGKPVFTEETSEEITQMLVHVVDNALLGGTVALPEYSIAAKTGTAQIPDTENGGYHSDRFLHSFFGYFPAYNPQFLIFLYHENPKGVRYASQTLTEPFMDLTKFLIHYYEIPPDR